MLVVLVFMLGSCSDQFNPNLPGKSSPVVYGVLNPADSVYRVRLTKTFIGEGNAFEYAKEADSLYYSDARVWMETRTKEGAIIQRADMQRTVIEERKPGIFATQPNVVYELSEDVFTLKPAGIEELGFPYQVYLHLFAEIPGSDEPLHASSKLQLPPTITQPRFTFYKVYLYSQEPFYMEWINTVMGNMYEISVTLNYREVREDGEHDQTVSWVLSGIQYNEVSVPGGSRYFYSYYFRPENFYAQVAANIKRDNKVSGRVAKTLDFEVLSSDQHMRNYRDVYRITDDYRGQGYTNVENGLGIFTTYTKAGIYGLRLGPQELDSLARGRYTRHLNFLPWD